MTTENSLRGKKARADGVKFELKVRKDLEAKGWIVDKWSNNVFFSLEYSGLCIAKRKYNPFNKVMAIGVGFPDFVCFKWGVDGCMGYADVIGVEAKSAKYLAKEEKAKIKWLLENKIFSKILVAYKGKNGEILYTENHSPQEPSRLKGKPSSSEDNINTDERRLKEDDR